MSGFDRVLQQRLYFEKALCLTPLELHHWIAQNQNQERWDWELWNQFIRPLQREINVLRHNPESAIPVDKDDGEEIPF